MSRTMTLDAIEHEKRQRRPETLAAKMQENHNLRSYVPLEKSDPPIIAWGPHAATAIGIILLGCLAFPAAQILVDLMGW